MKSKKKLILIILFLILTGNLISPLIQICIVSNYNKFNDENFPKRSDSGIHLYSPKNMTYKNGMRGYYPATYGFINDQDGTTPVGWQDLSAGNNYFRVISDKFGHKKVLRGNDIGNGVNTQARNYFDNKQGTIEFWWAINSVEPTNGYQISIHNSTGTMLFGLLVQGGQISVYTTTGWTEIVGLTMEANTWDHARLDFRSATGNIYESLTYNEFRLYYNGIVKGTYFFNIAGDPDYAMLYSGFANVGVAYFDAFGYSWDPNYNVGDNLEEGLLLSYSSDSIMEWVGYSLDKQNNITITGNKTIPMPSEGVHSIQIFSNDSMGDDFYSSLRYFTIDTTPYLEIVSPEPKVYTESISGYYLGTYGFEDDPNDYLPHDWLDYSGPHPIDTRVISEFNGHKKVVRGYDGGDGAFNLQNIINKSYGTVEWWWALNDVSTKSIQMCFFDNSYNMIFGILLENLHLNFWNSTGWITSPAITTQNNSWYHCRIDFEQTSGGYATLEQGTYQCYFNGTYCGTFTSGNMNEVNFLRFYSGYPESGVYGYLDAVGYSWDPNYNVGDNLNEDFFIGFKTNINLDWIGYSLDKQNNITISGNKTIHNLPDGMHVIQFFGRDNLNQTYSTDMLFFAINEVSLVGVKIIAQSFSIENFNLTFSISNIFGDAIDNAEIDIWWNNTDVSNDIQNLGEGLYFISLTPITVAPGEDPIPLNMIISAQGYLDIYFETTFAIDPDTLDKIPTKPVEKFPFLLILIIIFSSIAIVAITAITVIFIRRKRE